MSLFLIIAVLLLQKPTVTEQLKRCWDNYIHGYCRKICRTTEIREILCPNGRYCCLSIKELEERKKITEPPRRKPQTYAFTFPQVSDAEMETPLTPKTFSI
ncbi:beta-defensin 127 [Castor canadensis]|uniref:Beta-defensin 127 n=2 Tax=Castor canadensis TaxID=51338 RepID=A0AC58MPQ1_CASCN